MSPMNYRALGLLTASILLCSCAGQAPSGKLSAPTVPPPRPEIKPKETLSVSPAPTTESPPVVDIQDRPDVRSFIAEMSRKHGFGAPELRRVFAEVSIQPAILTAISKPYEAKPWYAYKKLFLTETRIQGGIDFRRRNAQALARAQLRYGVSPAIITAILGVESSYGQKPGNYRVIDALATLGFDYPKRAAFFRSELEQFLLLCREEGISPLQPLGSYAGAMGMPQFMPSSFRKLAADGDGDGRRDIWNNPADAIASVARYFSSNGWRSGEPVATSARAGQPGKLVELEEETGPAYWVGYHNFDVIMRYNHSPLYAMAVYELSRRFGPDAKM